MLLTQLRVHRANRPSEHAQTIKNLRILGAIIGAWTGIGALILVGALTKG